MAAEAGSPIMQLYHDSSSLFSALVVERSWWGGVVGKWGKNGVRARCVQGVQCLAHTRKRRRLFLKKL